jgi:COMPASS (Complex proteins associated with Set1p) component shg1
MFPDAMSFAKDSEVLNSAEPPRKRIKTSDLPLSSATRSAIEGLAHAFKKKGGYDTLRKHVWEKFEASVSELIEA